MSQAAIIIDLPNETASTAPAGSFLKAAEEAVGAVRKDFPAEAPAAVAGAFTFSTTTTDSDPGAAVIRLNAADQRAATRIYVDDADAGSKDWAAITARIGAIGNAVKARIRIQNTADAGNFIVFDVTSVIDASGYSKVVGTVVSYGLLPTGTSPTVVIANSASVTLSVEPLGDGMTRRAASLDSIVVASADLSALTAAEITALEVAAGIAAVDVVLATVETITVAGAAAGEVTGITGLLATDTLVKVFSATEANPPTVADLTAEFTVTAAATIDNTGGTSSAGESLIVVWVTE